MKTFKSFIPHAITFLNLNCGVIAVIAAVQNELRVAVLWMIMGIFFDFFDGLAARKFKVKSNLGKELDSLADIITSGLAPGIIVMQMLYMSFAVSYGEHWDFDIYHNLFYSIQEYPVILLGLFITMGSALRLAVFNLDTSQETSFVGLPTPANAIFIGSLSLLYYYDYEGVLTPYLYSPAVMVSISIFSAFMLNAPVRLFSLKIKDLSLASNKKLVLFVVFAVLLVLFLKWSAIPLSVLMYFIMGDWKRRAS